MIKENTKRLIIETETFFPEDRKDLNVFYYDAVNSDTLNIFLRGLDEAFLFTNLFSVILPVHFRDAKFFANQNESFMSIYLCSMIDIVPSIPPKRYFKELVLWKRVWKNMIMSIYNHYTNIKHNNIGKSWLETPDLFLKNLEQYLKVDPILSFAIEKVKNDFEYLNALRKYLLINSNIYFMKIEKFLNDILKSNKYKKIRIIARSGSIETAFLLAENFNINAICGAYIPDNILNKIDKYNFKENNLSLYLTNIDNTKKHTNIKNNQGILESYENDIYFDCKTDRFIHKSFHNDYHSNFFKFFVFNNFLL